MFVFAVISLIILSVCHITNWFAQESSNYLELFFYFVSFSSMIWLLFSKFLPQGLGVEKILGYKILLNDVKDEIDSIKFMIYISGAAVAMISGVCINYWTLAIFPLILVIGFCWSISSLIILFRLSKGNKTVSKNGAELRTVREQKKAYRYVEQRLSDAEFKELVELTGKHDAMSRHGSHKIAKFINVSVLLAIVTSILEKLLTSHFNG